MVSEVFGQYFFYMVKKEWIFLALYFNFNLFYKTERFIFIFFLPTFGQLLPQNAQNWHF